MDIRAVTGRRHPGRAATLRGLAVRAHHATHGHSQLREFLLRFGLCAFYCRFPLIHSNLWSTVSICSHSGPPPGEQLHSDNERDRVGGPETLHCACKVLEKVLENPNHVLVSFATKQELCSTSTYVFKQTLCSSLYFLPVAFINIFA